MTSFFLLFLPSLLLLLTWAFFPSIFSISFLDLMRRFSPGSRRWQVGHFDSCAGIRIPRRLFRLLLLLFIVAVRADVSLASWRVSFIASILTLVLVSFLFLVFVPSSLSLSQFWRHDSFLAGDMSRFCVGTRRCYWRFVSHQRVVTSFH